MDSKGSAFHGVQGQSPWPSRPSLRPALLIAGPTASGKSALAVALAERLGGTVINADSMQVYRDLRVLTARPEPADEARAPHALYGVRDAAEPGSAAWWRGAALAAMEAAASGGRLPILVGGTGLYFAALRDGLADVPTIPVGVREAVRAQLAFEGAAALHARLLAEDPATAARLRPSDGQRIARAVEVLRATGRGLAAWQRAGGRAALPWRLAALRLAPPRAVLREAVGRRFEAMLAQGGLEEARALRARGLDPALPAMRAHGVPELLAHLEGRLSLAEASARAVAATGRYTKRQATWFAHHELAPADATQIFDARYAGWTKEIELFVEFMASFVRKRD